MKNDITAERLWLLKILGLALLTFTAILVLIILGVGISLQNGSPRAALFNETCNLRFCSSDLNCINDKCVCKPNYYYSKGCKFKKTLMEKCSNSLKNCFDDTNLSCLDGVCKCDHLTYWNGESCVPKQTYNGVCQSSDIQCFTSSFLYCDIIARKCLCQYNR